MRTGRMDGALIIHDIQLLLACELEKVFGTMLGPPMPLEQAQRRKCIEALVGYGDEF